MRSFQPDQKVEFEAGPFLIGTVSAPVGFAHHDGR